MDDLDKELLKDAKRLGYDDPDEALRAVWKHVPKWLQKRILDSGFKLKKDEKEKGQKEGENHG